MAVFLPLGVKQTTIATDDSASSKTVNNFKILGLC
jgi:hypothetical protein